MRIALTLAALSLAAVAHAQHVAVSVNPHIVQKAGAPKPGEAQSTVVPPGLKSQCNAGRFLVTNDGHRPPEDGLVTGRDLDKPGGPDRVASFDNAPGQIHVPIDTGKSHLPEFDPHLYPRYKFVTNDHDLVTLHNGDVLYLTGAASRAYVDVPWFKHAYRGAFGPGARSVVLTWRSTDCGETFHYVGEFDPARVADGSCALPQFRRDANFKIINELPYDMGGSDGQTVHVDRTSNRLYLTFSCEGFHPAQSTPFRLNPRAPLAKTLVATSTDSGATWGFLGWIDNKIWRLDTVPLAGGALGFGFGDGVMVANKSGAAYDFGNAYLPVPNASFGWAAFPLKTGQSDPWFFTNVFGHTLTARTPSSNDFFIVYATTLPKGYGYRIAFYDRDKKAFADDVDDIVPANPAAGNFILHPVVVDNGSGPVLVYWNDVDFAAKTVTIRGRLIFGPADYSSDFVISRDTAGQPRSFPVAKKGPPGDWYGDYQTAGGFRHAASQYAQGAPAWLDVYYPMWIEPDGVIRFARVEIAEKGFAPNLRRVVVGPSHWHPQTAPAALSTLRVSQPHEVDTREHE